MLDIRAPITVTYYVLFKLADPVNENTRSPRFVMIQSPIKRSLGTRKEIIVVVLGKVR